MTMIKINPGFLLREVGGRNYVVAVEEASRKFNGMIKLNDSAKFVWQLLSAGYNEEQLLQAMLERYDIDMEEAQEDLKLFLDKLASVGILELVTNE